eukprot:PhM_4_TR5319/c0_g1_i2/m.81918
MSSVATAAATGSGVMIPKSAVVHLYRRYLKAAIKVPNPTIRMLLLQQVRAGFRRHRFVVSGVAQRELINQAFKDLEIIEDERLSRTLFINRYGAISCLECTWPMSSAGCSCLCSLALFLTQNRLSSTTRS